MAAPETAAVAAAVGNPAAAADHKPAAGRATGKKRGRPAREASPKKEKVAKNAAKKVRTPRLPSAPAHNKRVKPHSKGAQTMLT